MLVSIGFHNLGRNQKYEYFRCTRCGTEYPKINHRIMCNGKELHRCLCVTRTLKDVQMNRT